MISVCFQGKPFNIMVIQAYAPTSNAEEAEQFYAQMGPEACKTLGPVISGDAVATQFPQR